jgi:hypothetical protein
MKQLDLQFGVVIAFLLPGFILLVCVAPLIPKLFTGQSVPEASVGAFLFTVLAALATGLTLGAIRWLVVEQLVIRYCFPAAWKATLPKKNFEKLKEPNIYTAFIAINENHYNYYQYYGNTLVAFLTALVIYLVNGCRPSLKLGIGIAIVSVALLYGARDAFKKYHEHAGALLA